MKWNLSKPNPLSVGLYCKKLGISRIMAKVLLNRNVHGNVASKLVKNAWGLIEDAMKISGASDAAKDIIKHLNKRKKFYIYADYDVDGMTSGYIIADYLRSLSEEVEVIFPQRADGYGINMMFCEKLVVSKKECVVITVDNGITKADEVDYLLRNGIAVIVTDHHKPNEKMPRCTICDPHTDKDSAGHHLCGAGVIWKVLTLIDKSLRTNGHEFPSSYKSPDSYIAYVAIGTIGDMMPLTAENLAIIKNGLEQLHQNQIKALSVLFREGMFGSSRVNVRNIIFGLNSMLNACSRMGQTEKASELFFMEDSDYDDIYEYGSVMKDINEQRKSESKKAIEYVLKHYRPADKQKFMVAEIGNSTAGIAGLVATNLSRQFNIPVCIYNSKSENKVVSASVRSVKELNILKYLEEQQKEGNIVEYGGHSTSCGVKLLNNATNIKQFSESINASLQDIDLAKSEEQNVNIDAVITCREISDLLRAEIDTMPYNDSDFPFSVFCLKNVKVVAAKPSKGKDHIMYGFSDETGEICAVEWHGFQRYEQLVMPKRVDIAFSLEDFGLKCYGFNSDDLNLRILDMRVAV